MASVYKKVCGLCQGSSKKIPLVNTSLCSKIEENLMELITDLNTEFWLNIQPSLDISLKSVYIDTEYVCVWRGVGGGGGVYPIAGEGWQTLLCLGSSFQP